MKINAEDARHAVYDDSDKFELIESEMVDNSRWAIHYEAVLRHIPSGKYYKTPAYRVGATESQEEQPFEYETDVVLNEVELKEVVVKKWVSV